MTPTLRILAAAFALSLFVACGQSGPLYLPGNPSDVQQPPVTPETPAEEAEDDENDAAS